MQYANKKHRVIAVFFDGLDGSRTRVQKPIPCTSTIIVRYRGQDPFPPVSGNEHPGVLGSFIIRPCAQSLTHVVSHKSRCPVAKV